MNPTEKNASPMSPATYTSVTSPGGGRTLGQERKGNMYTGTGGESRGRGGLMPAGGSPRK